MKVHRCPHCGQDIGGLREFTDLEEKIEELKTEIKEQRHAYTEQMSRETAYFMEILDESIEIQKKLDKAIVVLSKGVTDDLTGSTES